MGRRLSRGSQGYGVTSFAIWDLKSISVFWSWALFFGYVSRKEEVRVMAQSRAKCPRKILLTTRALGPCFARHHFFKNAIFPKNFVSAEI